MKKKTRSLSILLSLSLCLSLTGCLGTDEIPAASSGISSVESVPAPSAAESSEAAESAPAESSEPESSEQVKPQSEAQSAPSDTPAQSTGAASEEDAPSGAPTPDTDTPSKESSAPNQTETVRVTFSEGATVARTADLLEAKGVTTGEAFFQAVEAMDVSAYPLAAAIEASAQRCFRLEGYLFPDTYEFYVGESPESVIARMLSNTEARITQTYRERAAELGMTMDEAVTLASIIQKEAPADQMETVSSVLHNRLNAGMRLQCDVTIKYVEGAIKPYISGDVNRYNAYYNTYKCAALPAGAICNPGLSALKAALWPESTGYLYFAFDTSGNYYYSETYEEHLQQCQDAGIAVGGQS